MTDESKEPAKLKQSVSTARSALRREWLRFLAVALAGAVLGWLYGEAAIGYAFAVTLFVIFQMRRAGLLRRWLESPKHHELDEPGGLWGEIYEKLIDLQRRNRKRKKKLAAIVAEFRASTAALPDGAVVLGHNGEILWFNGAAQALLGLQGKMDVGLRIANLIRNPQFAEYVEDAEYLGEVEVSSPVNASIRISLRIIPYGKGQRLMIVRDISEIRRLETARRDFVSNASHELRTPLTVLRGYLDMIEPESRNEGPLASWNKPIEEMRSQTGRMESLINDMLKLARLESEIDARQEVIDVAALIRKAVEEARSLSQGAHEISAQIDADLRLYGRESEAQSIFNNLIFNAVRYTPEGGSISVTWAASEDGALFSVVDTGIGIAEEDIPRLTERFYRVDVGRSRASGGTGLGLSIVKHALQRHEAHLDITSELGKGSRFVCSFPGFRIHKAGEAPEMQKAS